MIILRSNSNEVVMKKYSALLIVLVIAFSCGGRPRIVFDSSTHNFGKVPQKSIVKHIFSFRNTGDGTLEIEKVQTTCGCTSTVLSKKRIPVGKRGKIEVALNTSSYDGKISRSVYVFSNDTSREYVRLVVSANVVEKK